MRTPLKTKHLKIGLRHVLSWPKLSLQPKFHDPGTFFTFFAIDRLAVKRGKNANFEKRLSLFFKLVQF